MNLNTQHPLEVGEKTVVHMPDHEVSYHHFRRTESGYETCFTLTHWRPISREKVAEAMCGGLHQ